MFVLTSRRLLSLCVLALTLSTTAVSCSSVTKDAARFDEQSLATSELDDLLVGYATAVPTAFLASGNVDVAIAQGIIQNWISTQAIISALKSAGVEVSGQDLTDALSELEQQEGFSLAPQVIQDFYILSTAAQTLAVLHLQVSDQEIRSSYEELGIQSGAVCLQAILTEAQTDIAAAFARLEAGEDFATVAEETSIDPSAAQGGALTDASGSNCLDLATFQNQVTPEFLNSLAQSEVGVPTEPFEIVDTGWVILYVRPFEDVAEDASALLTENAAMTAGQNALALAKIWVSAEYGRWDSQSMSVLPLD